ncbi:hypothetical protein AB0A60_29575 [Streptomyces sp. NPDC046275]|uniref:hypothetical protein n=1 Tax=Streptomyces sp. NPDC046275 TaxID=3157201 RepID=UPI0033F438B2
MHGTRTPLSLLAGVAMAAALTGCVAVEPPPAAPAPAASGGAASPAGQDVAPQIVPGPAREALEAALPDPPEPRAAVERRRTDAPSAPAAPRRTERPRPSAVPQQKHPRPRTPEVHVPGVPEVPRDRAGVCALGQAYGGWSPDSPQARLCKGTHGH